MLDHPHLQQALRIALGNHIHRYRCSQILNRVLNDRGRKLGGMLVLYLHYASLADGNGPGMTVASFLTFCADLGLCSPGRARALLMILKYGSYITSAPGAADRRQRRLVPTERLIEEHRQSWKCHFEGMTLIMPDDAQRGLDLLDRPEFVGAFVCRLGAAYLAGFRILRYAPELADLAERNAGLLIAIHLFLAATDGAAAPGGMAVTLSPSALSSQFGIARAHVRNLLAAAAAAGLLIRLDSTTTVVVLPRLVHAISRLFAAHFALLTHCADAAAIDIKGTRLVAIA